MPVRQLESAPRALLLGGAPRAGKSRLTRRLWLDHSMPSVSMDAVIAIFMRLDPEFGLNWHQSSERDERIAKAASVSLEAALHVYERVVVEGESVTPAVAAELRDAQPVQACFMVLLEPSLARMLEFEDTNVWLRDLDKAKQLWTFGQIVERSEWIVDECNRLDFPYVDMSSGNYLDRTDEVVQTLLGNSSP